MSEKELEKAAPQDAPITDAELDKAAEEIEEPVAEAPEVPEREEQGEAQEVEVDEVPEKAEDEEKEEVAEERAEAEDLEEPPKTDNAARSRLGRRVAGLEEKINQVLQNLQTLSVAKDTKVPEPEIQDEIDLDMPATIREFEAYQAKKAEKAEQETRYYQTNYIKSVYDMGKEVISRDIYNETLKEMDNNSVYNIRHTGDPKVDAKLNFMAAYSAILAKQVKSGPAKKNPLEKNETKRGTGDTGAVSGSKNTGSRAGSKVELDSDAKEFLSELKSRGGLTLTEEDVEAALGSEVKSVGSKSYFPSHTLGRK